MQSPGEVLCKAVRKSQRDVIRSILSIDKSLSNYKRGESLYSPCGGESPLLIAAKRGSIESCSILIEAGASVNQSDNKNITPLHEATSNGHLEVCRLLIENGATVNAADEIGCTSLHLACWGGYFAESQLLIQHGADVNVLDGENKTPLHWAAENGNSNICHLLLQHGSTFHSKSNCNGSSQTALHLAIDNYIGKHYYACAAAMLVVYVQMHSSNDVSLSEKQVLSSCLDEMKLSVHNIPILHQEGIAAALPSAWRKSEGAMDEEEHNSGESAGSDSD